MAESSDIAAAADQMLLWSTKSGTPIAHSEVLKLISRLAAVLAKYETHTHKVTVLGLPNTTTVSTPL